MNNQINLDMIKQFAFGMMLEYTENEFINDETLNNIEREIINLYNKIHNSELNKMYFYTLFYHKYDYNSFLQLNQLKQDKKFFILMKDLILSLKYDYIKDFDYWLKLEKQLFIEDGEYSEFIDYFPSIIYNCFTECNKPVRKINELYYLDIYNNTLSIDINFQIMYSLNDINFIYIKNDYETKNIVISRSSRKYLSSNDKNDENILYILKEMKDNETMHFIYEEKEIIVYKSNNSYYYQQYSNKNLLYFLYYIFNTNNNSLLSKSINLINYKILNKLNKEEKNKINKYIKYSNKRNEIILKKNISNDIIKNIINKNIFPEEIEYVCVYEFEKRMKNMKILVYNFFKNYNNETENSLKKLLSFIIKELEELNIIISNKKYKKIHRNFQVEIFKLLFKLYLTELGNKLLLKGNKKLIYASKDLIFKIKNNWDIIDEELNISIDLFLEKY